ncbi:LysR family transcriptional regulator [Dickeya oryzae]
MANLEADLGLQLFDRRGHQPVLTDEGRKVLSHVKAILAASEALDELSIRLADKVEPRLTFVLSDTWQCRYYHPILQRFAVRFPDVEFECLIAEDEDVVDLLQSQRAHVGVLQAQAHYPIDIAVSRLQVKTEMAVYVARTHPLAQQTQVTQEQLATVRQLCLHTYSQRERPQTESASWSTPSYLMLLEMAQQGFGWSTLPRWLVKEYAQNQLVELSLPGWPRQIEVDIAWSRPSPPGPAGLWLIDTLLEQRE